MTLMKKTSLALSLAAASLLNVGYAETQERYIVKFKPGKGQGVAASVAQGKGRVERQLSAHDAMAVSLPAQALKALERNPNVEYVEADVKRYMMSETIPYGIPMVQADQLSDAAASNTLVCIIDSGYDGQHEDLNHNGAVQGTSDPGTGDWFTDENGHGTHVAGTIAGVANNVGVVGVLPNSNLNLHIIKVFSADGWAYSSGLVAALDACKAAKADRQLDNMVINMSLGGSRSNRTEMRAFEQAFGEGVLSIAAAGNDGNTRHSYPASYDSVVSVAAIDENKAVADFSQQTNQVELAAPGVGVLSSVPMDSAAKSDLTVDGSAYASAMMDGSPIQSVSGDLVDCGTGEASCAASGKVCLIARGNVSFADKVLNCQSNGGIGAVIYNNEPGMLYGTLGETSTSIPSVGISDSAGAALKASLGRADLAVSTDHYAYFDGTSMATPHVAGVAALVWSHNPTCSNSEVRTALASTAEDLGTAGRDDAYGHGLIRAYDAHLALASCTGSSGGGDTGGGGGSDKPGKGKKNR
ncbi:PA domain-containing protein [Ferrimonas sediminum]|uniref:PA domain-containing protein n=1 Tax=Ferrimonas sediminum TaxID=718193 RepID=A0A1G8NP34_9GAMM|nr:S8 family serine peptidase [Ferrimonas sediminum]SDI81973.1 PA domain-containing protein [Ferrimonas sediminum]